MFCEEHGYGDFGKYTFLEAVEKATKVVPTIEKAAGNVKCFRGLASDGCIPAKPQTVGKRER